MVQTTLVMQSLYLQQDKNNTLHSWTVFSNRRGQHVVFDSNMFSSMLLSVRWPSYLISISCETKVVNLRNLHLSNRRMYFDNLVMFDVDIRLHKMNLMRVEINKDQSIRDDKLINVIYIPPHTRDFNTQVWKRLEIFSTIYWRLSAKKRERSLSDLS